MLVETKIVKAIFKVLLFPFWHRFIGIVKYYYSVRYWVELEYAFAFKEIFLFAAFIISIKFKEKQLY